MGDARPEFVPALYLWTDAFDRSYHLSEPFEFSMFQHEKIGPEGDVPLSFCIPSIYSFVTSKDMGMIITAVRIHKKAKR
jgi:hypothetical protein